MTQQPTRKPPSFILNLKHLPPLDPSIVPPTYQARFRNPNSSSRYVVKQTSRTPEEKEGGGGMCSTKHVDPNSTQQINEKNEISRGGPAVEEQDVAKKVPAKSRLHEICAMNKWKLPKYECCKEEGPCHRKLFTFNVVVEIPKPDDTTLECYGGPLSTKKKAAEHAAEGALWYLRQMGYQLAADK